MSNRERLATVIAMVAGQYIGSLGIFSLANPSLIGVLFS